MALHGKYLSCLALPAHRTAASMSTKLQALFLTAMAVEFILRYPRSSLPNESMISSLADRSNQTMKPTPKKFASRLAPLRCKLTHSLPLFRPSGFPSMSHRFPRAPFSVFATAPSTSSRFPASLVPLKLVYCPHSLAPTLVVLPSMSLGPPLHSLGSRTPAVLL